jgi:hypothetical protein
MTRSELVSILAPSQFSRNAAGVVGGLVFVASILIAFSLGPAEPFGFFVTLTFGALVAVFIRSVRAKHRSHLEASWTEFYAGSKWKTPAGEEVLVALSNYDGNVVTVRFDDGYSRKYSAWLLEPIGSIEKLPRPAAVDRNETLLETVSKTRWKHLDGRTGVVRSARRDQLSGEVAFVDYITLKTEDGTHEYERNYLSPV